MCAFCLRTIFIIPAGLFNIYILEALTLEFIKTKNRNNLLKHITSFYIIWAISEVFFFPFLRATGDIFDDIIGPLWKISVWLLPVIAILKTEHHPLFTYLKLNFANRAAMLWSALGIAFIAAYNVLMHVLFLGNIAFSPALTFMQWLNVVFIAGIVEEILFRGYFLQKIKEHFSFWKSNLLVSLLFVSIHFPIWYVNADKIAHNPAVWGQLTAFIFAFSLLQGWLLRKSGSLWPCIMMHMMNNFMALSLH